MTAVTAAFATAKAENRAALVGYLPAGFPSVDAAIEAAKAMAQAGADIIEIGLPYSDPLMDGPVIQEAVYRALTGGVHVADVLATVEAVAAAGVPTLIMTYWNPVDRYGVESFAADLAKAGGSGLITPDLTPEEAGPWLAAAAEHGLDPVFLVAPSSSERRIELITAACGGFVYAASLMGTTGASDGRKPGGRPGQPGPPAHRPARCRRARRPGRPASGRGRRLCRRRHRRCGIRTAPAHRERRAGWPGRRPRPGGRVAAGVRAGRSTMIG